MTLLKAYLAIVGIIGFLLYIVINAINENANIRRNQTVDVSPDIYNWIHVDKSYWVCAECETELGSVKVDCLDCGTLTEKYRITSKKSLYSRKQTRRSNRRAS